MKDGTAIEKKRTPIDVSKAPVEIRKAVFINDAKAKWGNLFSYELVDYVNNSTDVKVRCTKHNNVIDVRPSSLCNANHSRSICDMCFEEEYYDSLDNTNAQPLPLNNAPPKALLRIFTARAQKKWGQLYDFSKVKLVNNTTPVTVICNNHKKPHTFEATPKRILNAKHAICDRCAETRKHKALKKGNHFAPPFAGIADQLRVTNKSSLKKREALFKARVQAKWGGAYGLDYAIYKDTNTKLVVECRAHGEPYFFHSTPKNLYTAKRAACDRCYKEMAGTFQNEWRDNPKHPKNRTEEDEMNNPRMLAILNEALVDR